MILLGRMIWPRKSSEVLMEWKGLSVSKSEQSTAIRIAKEAICELPRALRLALQPESLASWTKFSAKRFIST